MVSNNEVLSSRRISLLEEVKEFLEDNRLNNRLGDVNVGASTSRQSILTAESSESEESLTTRETVEQLILQSSKVQGSFKTCPFHTLCHWLLCSLPKGFCKVGSGTCVCKATSENY